MKAAVLRKLSEPLSIEELDLTKLKSGQVLVKMQQAAVCHSQRLEVAGRRGPDRFLPHLIGHEGVGVVLDRGADVAKVRAGDQVILSWIRGSGKTGEPITYHSKEGIVNAGPIATFCETPIVSESCLTPIPNPVRPEQAVLVGCALPTGAGTVWNALTKTKEHRSVCILGAGGVGLSALAGAVCENWEKRIIVDLKETRLQRALSIGATHTISATNEDVAARVLEITEGAGADLVIECAGSVKTMELAPKLARLKTGCVVIAGNLTTGQTFAIDPFDLIKGRTLKGSWGGWVNPDTDFLKILNLILASKIRPDLLTGKRFPLEAVNEALLSLDDETAGRPIIEFPS